MIKAALIAGARPNFIKIAAIEHAFRSSGKFKNLLIHTGQHYDARMSDIFFRQLGMPEPDLYLGVGSGSHAEQTARVMTEIEPVFIDHKPDVVVVVGDVNSTVATALTARKLHIPLVHVEAGLRSFDRTMPEEVNRIVTDSISDMMYVSEPSGRTHLLAEGHPEERIVFTGNVMIDSLRRFQSKAAATAEHTKRGLNENEYFLITAHRPAMVDVPENLTIFATALLRLADQAPVIFPIHPRTASKLASLDIGKRLENHANVHLTGPIGYLEFMCLMMHSGLIVTDSGGIQEESTALLKPCVTVRPNTERPVTVKEGTNELMDLDAAAIIDAGRRALSGGWKKGRVPELWDGKAAERIATHLADWLSPGPANS
ncbi:MAG: UDP-N-acetylglucosamine 2-epimerase (non-hydrolyzing) [Bacteroidetes bacterium]|nr:UDP-N-acetylglucosamine 2-epimerase (non-hydrolyzing) [Bacteroidota bacterium]MDA1333212.1 UDP-N-acetylglucosamine 2-epimerase (non-hydrolyzing) [Bacteroidota bacterium]